MMKLIKTLALILLISTAGFGQKNIPEDAKIAFFIKGGVGTSWITMPKVFLINSADTSSAQILPATNSFTGYVGLQAAIPLGEHWPFMPEIDFNYISGQIKVDLIENLNQVATGNVSQKLQSYTRIELPLNFGIISSDNFWVSFGPVLFFTISDNKGFEAAVDEVSQAATPPFQVPMDSDNPVGLRFRLAAYVIIGKGMYVDFKFDSDLNRKFWYTESDDTYHMRMSLQSVTVGFGYRLNRAGL